MENSIVRTNNNLVELEKGDNKKIFVSLDLSKEENIDLLLESQDNEKVLKVNDHKGEVIECVGVYITRRENEDTNDDGEVFTRRDYTTLLFDKEGKIYVTGSNAFYQSLDFICTLKGWPSEANPVKIKFAEAPAKEVGHKYLRAVIVK